LSTSGGASAARNFQPLNHKCCCTQDASLQADEHSDAVQLQASGLTAPEVLQQLMMADQQAKGSSTASY
jgi:hypothetical protein